MANRVKGQNNQAESWRQLRTLDDISMLQTLGSDDRFTTVDTSLVFPGLPTSTTNVSYEEIDTSKTSDSYNWLYKYITFKGLAPFTNINVNDRILTKQHLPSLDHLLLEILIIKLVYLIKLVLILRIRNIIELKSVVICY